MSDDRNGIRRRRSGKSFRYLDPRGRPVRDRATLQRIRSLAVPPAWTDVWICPREDGHLQATGRDARGRKQHRYHPLWREVRDATKFEHMIDFAAVLPRIRKRVARDLTRSRLGREKVLAAVVRLLDSTLIRVGNDEYAKSNDSYGLTTMKDRHVRVRGEKIRFRFRGKGRKFHEIEIDDRRLARIVKRCQDIPGQGLFQYLDEHGEACEVTSGDVNDYLREISGADLTAKDFRTWAGTVLAAEALRDTELGDERQAKRNVTAAIERVAERMGNTPAVCRKCYVHPSVLDGYVKGTLPRGERAAGSRGARRTAGTRSLGPGERDVLRFLRRCRREERRRWRELEPELARLPEAWRPRAAPRGERSSRRRHSSTGKSSTV